MSSQMIVTSSALVEDPYKALGRHRDDDPKSDSHYVTLGRLGCCASRSLRAPFWEQNATILRLVAFAWAGFGAAFGPTVVLSLYWRKLTAKGALAGMVVGAVRCGAVRCGAVRCGAVRCGALWDETVGEEFSQMKRLSGRILIEDDANV